MKKVLLKLLLFYKKYISRGEYCRFYPSCSNYSYEAISKYGVWKGGWLAVKRISRCHPWTKGGIDLVE